MKASVKDYSYNVELHEPHSEKKTYCISCRLCRKQLIVSDKIKFSHLGKVEPCGKCLFLDEEEFLPDWIKDEIENSSWTKGRLKCPRVDCTARVGGFDFIQGLLCGCGELTIPAIWIQDGKVDVKAVNNNDFMSKTKPSLTSSDKLPSRRSSSVNIRKVINSDDVMSKTKPSVMSSDKSQSRQTPVLKVSSAGNSTNTLEQPGCFDRMNQGSFCPAIGESLMNAGTNVITQSVNVTDTIMTEDLSSSKPVQGASHQDRRETYEFGFPQSIHHDKVNNASIAEIRTGELSTLPYPMTPTVRHRKNKVNHMETTFVEQNIDKTHSITKPTEIKVSDRRSSNRFDPLRNRFNPLSVEEPVIVKPSEDLHTVIQEHLICAVCLDYFYKPYQCQCSHIFCESCLRQLYHNRAGKLKCPICRSPVKYIEPANQIREEIRQLQNPAIKQRELFEKMAKYRMWPLPPIGPLPFLRRQQTLVPKQDQNLVILASILLLVVCYTILYILP